MIEKKPPDPPVVVFKLNEEEAIFEQVEVDQDNLDSVLDSRSILLFLNPMRFKAWIWNGCESTTRMKFIAKELAPVVRDRGAVAMNLQSADDGKEPLLFKVLMGWEVEPDNPVIAYDRE